MQDQNSLSNDKEIRSDFVEDIKRFENKEKEKIVYELHNIAMSFDIYSFFFTDKHFIGLCTKRSFRPFLFVSMLGWRLFPIGGVAGAAIQVLTDKGIDQLGKKHRQNKQQINIDNFRSRLQHEDIEQLIKDMA